MKLRMSGFVVAVIVALSGHGGPLATLSAGEWLDTFEDGVVFDGNPPCGNAACWYQECGTQGTFEVVCGELHVGNAANPGFTAVLRTAQAFVGDVSVRSQVSLVGGSAGSSLGLYACFRVPCNGCYIARLQGNGQLYLVRWDGGPWNEQTVHVLGQASVPNFLRGAEYVLQLGKIGNHLEVRCWPPTENFPAEPHIQADDAYFASGYGGLGYTSQTPDPQARGVFRYLQVSDTMIGPEGYSESGPPCPSEYKRGDPNASNGIDIADAIFTLSFLFAKGTVPACLDAADANDSGAIDIADPIAILGHLFAQAGPLPEPFGACGIDPTEDALGCENHAPCE